MSPLFCCTSCVLELLFLGEGEKNIDEFYELLGPAEGENKKFGIKTTEYQIRWNKMNNSPYFEKTVESAIAEILSRIYAEGKRGDQVGVTIIHPALGNPILIRYSPQEKLTADKIMKCIWRVQQSKKELNFDETLFLKFSRIRAPVGGRPRQW